MTTQVKVYDGRQPENFLYTVDLSKGPFEEIDCSKLIAFEYPDIKAAEAGVTEKLRHGYELDCYPYLAKYKESENSLTHLVVLKDRPIGFDEAEVEARFELAKDMYSQSSVTSHSIRLSANVAVTFRVAEGHDVHQFVKSLEQSGYKYVEGSLVGPFGEANEYYLWLEKPAEQQSKDLELLYGRVVESYKASLEFFDNNPHLTQTRLAKGTH